ncbi:MAG: T9SS type A sorting domain-containing protein [Bacteroidetes bacterium]|nr:T9SS type A sorting domain-containing protein [Bacteroidota bacterium]
MKPFFLSIILLFSAIHYSSAQIVDGYTDKLSYRAGETVVFYTKSVLRNGTQNFILRAIDNTISSQNIGFTLTTQPGMNTYQPWYYGYDYTATATWTVPSGFKSGLYFLNSSVPVPIIIKGEDKSTADIIIVIPTNTDEAYNYSQGVNMYQIDPSTHHEYPVMSFHRPGRGQPQLYEGFLKWFATTNYNNMNVSYISDMDMDDYSEIAHAKLLILIGHSEYWTRQAKQNFDQFVDAGKDAMVLGGNNMWWQVRYNDDKTRLICYRDGNIDTDECDPLLKTIQWEDPSLKHSALSSIGADWLRGGYGTHEGCYNGFNGHKMILLNSPLLNGVTLPSDNTVHFTTGEFDGTLISSLDANGNPILDVSALGFYRAELIGYDQTSHIHDNESGGLLDRLGITNMRSGMKYTPFMIFQKTCTSGKIINVSSNYWCSEYGIGGSNSYDACQSWYITTDYVNMRKLTSNMIDLLLAHDETNHPVFVNSAPTTFSMKATATTVSYSACMNGSIHVTPCGVTITDGYKVDNNNNRFEAKIENCISCTRSYARMAAATSYPSATATTSEGKANSLINDSQDVMLMSPNPTSGIFSLQLQEIATSEISIYNPLGQLIFQSSIINNQSSIDLSAQPKGMYFVKVNAADGQMFVQKVILQ